MRLLYVLAMLSGVAAAPAAAAPKWTLTGSNERTIMFADDNSITRFDNGNRVAVKVVATFAKPLLNKYSGQTLTIEYDCKSPRYREADVLFTDRTGSVILTGDVDPPDTWYTIESSGSIEESTRRYVCFGDAPEGPSTDPWADSKKRFGW